MRASLEERFWKKVDKSEGCWQWTGGTSQGYGMFHTHVENKGQRGTVRAAHRIAYQLVVGPIPDGLHIDHLCRNQLCVNPAHLEPVTSAENSRRGAVARNPQRPAGSVIADYNVKRRTPFVCPTCGKSLTRVTDSRPWQNTIKRRRVCASGHAWTTREYLVQAS